MDVGIALKVSNQGSEVNQFQQAGQSPLVLAIERALRATGYMPLRDLRVMQYGSTVTLQGCVASYHLKQLAQATAMGICRFENVSNEVEVVSERTREARFATEQRLSLRTRTPR